MGLKPYQEKIIQQMVTQEKLLSRLYTLFAQQFPNHAEFWGKLSKEEENHAKLIEKLREAEKKGLIFFQRLQKEF